MLNNALLYFSLDFSQAWLFVYLTGLFIFSDVAAILRSGDQLRHQQMFISASRSAGTLCEVHRDFSKGLLTFVSREKCQPVYTVLYPWEHTRFLSFPHKYMLVNCRIISGSDRFKSYHLSSSEFTLSVHDIMGLRVLVLFPGWRAILLGWGWPCESEVCSRRT